MSDDSETVKIPKTDGFWPTLKRELLYLFLIALLCGQAAVLYRRNARLRHQLDWCMGGWDSAVKRSVP
jgi:hypothetical protein